MSQNSLSKSKGSALNKSNFFAPESVEFSFQTNGNSALSPAELLCALVDGPLSANDFDAVSDFLALDDSILERWNSYHLIGDVLRSHSTPARTVDTAFLSRLNAQLAKETLPKALIPSALSASSASAASLIAAEKVVTKSTDAANDSNFRWKVLAGFASLFCVLVIAWNSAGFSAARPETQSQLAEASTAPPVVVASPQGLMARDARFEELLAAHSQLGSGSVLEVPSGFLRNATYETPQTAGR